MEILDFEFPIAIPRSFAIMASNVNGLTLKVKTIRATSGNLCALKFMVAVMLPSVERKDYELRLHHEMALTRKPVIAIVDDDTSVRRAIARLVVSTGVAAETFASGQELIDLFEARPSFDVNCVVLDVQMTGPNGFQVQKYLKSTRPSIPVIFVSAARDSWVRQQALASGAIAFFDKPFNADSFIKTVLAIIRMQEDDQRRV